MIVNVLIVFISILALALAMHAVWDIPSANTPFMAMSLDLCLITVFAYYNLLFAGCILVCGISILMFLYALLTKKANIRKIKTFFSPGVVFFIVCSVALTVYFAIRQPVYCTWDEFSFWGTAHKLTKINGAIYTFYESSMIGVTTPATLSLLSYFFQFFATGFAPWVSYVAYDVLFFSAFSAIISRFSWDEYHKAFMGYTAAFFAVYFFRLFSRTTYFTGIYMDSLSDVALSIICAGALALYMSTDDRTKGVLYMLPTIFMLTGVKDMGFALSSILAFMVFCEMLFEKGVSVGKIKGFFAKIILAVAIEFTTVLAFAGWTIHMSKVMSVNRFELGGESNMGMAQMLIRGVQQLFSKQPIEKFAIIKQSMISAFFNFKVCMLGSGVVAVAIIGAVFIFAIILADRKDKIRFAMLYISSFISYVAYYIFHLFLYVFIFKDNGYNLEGYSRYFSTIYTFWLMCSIIVLLYVCYKARFKLLASAGMFAYSMALCAVRLFAMGPQTAFYNYHTITLEKERFLAEKAETIRDCISPEDRLYLISVGDSGLSWFVYTYELCENVIYRDMPQLDWTLTDVDDMQEMKKEFTQYLSDHEITHLIIDATDPQFERFFEGDIDWDETGEIGMYDLCLFKIDYSGDIAKYDLVKKGTTYEKAL